MVTLRRHAPAALRSRAALLAVLARRLPRPARLLELGSGTGQHAAFCAPRLPGLTWQPSDPDEASRDSIRAWTAREGAAGVLPPLQLDLLAPAWRRQRCDALLVVNVLHVAPEGAAEALLSGAPEVLPPGGLLFVGGPFGEADLARLAALGARWDLALDEVAPLADGCRLLVFKRS